MRRVASTRSPPREGRRASEATQHSNTDSAVCPPSQRDGSGAISTELDHGRTGRIHRAYRALLPRGGRRAGAAGIAIPPVEGNRPARSGRLRLNDERVHVWRPAGRILRDLEASVVRDARYVVLGAKVCSRYGDFL